MILKLLLLKRLSPTFYRLRLAWIMALGLLFLVFAAEVGYLMYKRLTTLPSYPSIHTPRQNP
jgi:hypothetical protein